MKIGFAPLLASSLVVSVFTNAVDANVGGDGSSRLVGWLEAPAISFLFPSRISLLQELGFLDVKQPYNFFSNTKPTMLSMEYSIEQNSIPYDYLTFSRINFADQFELNQMWKLETRRRFSKIISFKNEGLALSLLGNRMLELLNFDDLTETNRPFVQQLIDDVKRLEILIHGFQNESIIEKGNFLKERLTAIGFSEEVVVKNEFVNSLMESMIATVAADENSSSSHSIILIDYLREQFVPYLIECFNYFDECSYLRNDSPNSNNNNKGGQTINENNSTFVEEVQDAYFDYHFHTGRVVSVVNNIINGVPQDEKYVIVDHILKVTNKETVDWMNSISDKENTVRIVRYFYRLLELLVILLLYPRNLLFSS